MELASSGDREDGDRADVDEVERECFASLSLAVPELGFSDELEKKELENEGMKCDDDEREGKAF